MSNESDSLLREVDDELRREQLQKLWERYNTLIVTGAMLIVAAVGGFKFLENRRVSAAQSAGADFSAALRLESDKKSDDAAKAFQAIADTGPKGYAALAKLHVAGEYVKAGKSAEALAAFEALAKDGSSDPLLKSYAQLQAASLRLGEADFTEIQNRATPLAGDDGAFKTSARELLGIAAFKAGKFDEARKYLEPLLIDPTASRPIQERIKVIMAVIAAPEVAKSAAATAPEKSMTTAPEKSTTPAAPAAATDTSAGATGAAPSAPAEAEKKAEPEKK